MNPSNLGNTYFDDESLVCMHILGPWAQICPSALLLQSNLYHIKMSMDMYGTKLSSSTQFVIMFLFHPIL